MLSLSALHMPTQVCVRVCCGHVECAHTVDWFCTLLDGCAPYFTVVAYNPSDAPAHPLRTLARWDAVKAAASAALQAHHGTCTHHHAVGRDHQPFYEQEVRGLCGEQCAEGQRTANLTCGLHTQMGAVFLKMLAAVKAAVDPAWVCNPGVLLRTSSSSYSGASKL